MKTKCVVGVLVCAAVLVIAGGATARAQSEFTGYGGGVHLGGGGGSHALAGAAYGYNASDRAQLFAEVNYIPLSSTTLFSDFAGTALSGSSKAVNFGLGVLYSAGSASSKVKPYVLGTVGDGRFIESYTYKSPLGNVSASGSYNEVYAGVGAGLRMLVGDHWGVRPEVRFQRYLQNGGANIVIANVGLFFQFGR
jgi:hypothetical protein